MRKSRPPCGGAALSCGLEVEPRWIVSVVVSATVSSSETVPAAPWETEALSRAGDIVIRTGHLPAGILAMVWSGEAAPVLGWGHLTELGSSCTVSLTQASVKLEFPGIFAPAGANHQDESWLAACKILGRSYAGAAIVEITEDVDERTNAVLVTFRQERRSSWGLLGGEPARASYDTKPQAEPAAEIF